MRRTLAIGLICLTLVIPACARKQAAPPKPKPLSVYEFLLKAPNVPEKTVVSGYVTDVDSSGTEFSIVQGEASMRVRTKRQVAGLVEGSKVEADVGETVKEGVFDASGAAVVDEPPFIGLMAALGLDLVYEVGSFRSKAVPVLASAPGFGMSARLDLPSEEGSAIWMAEYPSQEKADEALSRVAQTKSEVGVPALVFQNQRNLVVYLPGALAADGTRQALESLLGSPIETAWAR